MSASQVPFNPAEALGEHLAERVRVAARSLLDAADALTVEAVPHSGYTPAALELRVLLDAVFEQAITYDLYVGPGLAAVADALKVTERTVRARYGGGPRDLPLLVALDEE